jgi:hypothetical protein
MGPLDSATRPYEIKRYRLDKYLERSIGTTTATLGGPECVYIRPDGLQKMTNAEYEVRAAKAFDLFFNIDGDGGRTILDWLHRPQNDSEQARELHSMTVVYGRMDGGVH